MPTFASLHCASLSDIGRLSADDMRALRLSGRLRVGIRCFKVRLEDRAQQPHATGPSAACRYVVTTSSVHAGGETSVIARRLEARHAELRSQSRSQSPLAQRRAVETAAADAMDRQQRPWWVIGRALRLRDPLASLLRKLVRGGQRLCGINLGPPPTPDQRFRLWNVALHGIDLSGSTVTGMWADRVDMTRAVLVNTRLSDFVARRLRFDRANLHAARFIGRGAFNECSFDGANFFKAVLIDATFFRCNGRGAFFREASLGAAMFTACRLNGAIFARAWLRDAQFHQTDLRGTDFREANLASARFKACDLSGIRFSSWTSAGKTRYKNCAIAHAGFHGASMSQTRFVDCKLEHVHFGLANLEGATFRRCTLRNVSFFMAELHRMKFVDCRLDGVDFSLAEWPQGRLKRTTLTNICLAGTEMDRFEAGDGQWLLQAPLHATASFSIDAGLALLKTRRAALANRRPLLDTVLPRCIHALPRGQLDEERHAALRVRLMESLALAIAASRPAADLALPWQSCLLDTVMAHPMYAQRSGVLACLADAYASRLLSVGNTMLFDWPDTKATMTHCLSYGIDQLVRDNGGRFAQDNSAALMQLVLRIRLQRDPALDMAVETLEANYLDRLPEHVGRLRSDLAPDAFPLWDGATALLIHPEYYENRLLRRPPAPGRAPFDWAEYIPLRPRPEQADGEAAATRTNPFAATPFTDFAPFPLLRTAHLASTLGGGRIRTRYLQALRLGADEALITAAFATGEKPRGSLAHPERLLAHIEGPEQLQRLQFPEGDIAEAHFATLKALYAGFPSASEPKPLGTLLFCFATLFTRLASRQGFGTESASPEQLRWYAGALLRRACKLDPELKDVASERQWVHRLCGIFPPAPLRDVVYTCANQIYADMARHLSMARSDPSTSLVYDAVWPESWR